MVKKTDAVHRAGTAWIQIAAAVTAALRWPGGCDSIIVRMGEDHPKGSTLFTLRVSATSYTPGYILR